MEKFKSILMKEDLPTLLAGILAKEEKDTLRKKFRRYYGVYKHITGCPDEVERAVFRGMKIVRVMGHSNTHTFETYMIEPKTEHLQERKIYAYDLRNVAELMIPDVLRKEYFNDTLICTCILEECVRTDREEHYIRDDEKTFKKVKALWKKQNTEICSEAMKEKFYHGESYIAEADASIRAECEKLPKYEVCFKSWKEILEGLTLEREDCLKFNSHNPPNFERCNALLTKMKNRANHVEWQHLQMGVFRIEITNIGIEGESLPRMCMRFHSQKVGTVDGYKVEAVLDYPIYIFGEKELSHKEIFLLYCMEKLYPIRMRNQRKLERNLILD